MSTFVRERELSIGDLEKVVRSGEPLDGVSKMRALTALERRQREGGTEILQRVAANTKEEPNYRHMAIMGLYRAEGREAREPLLKIARNADGEPAADIAVVLGRIGEAGDRDVVERLKQLAPRHARQRAAFALTLLDYRFGEKSAQSPFRDLKPTTRRVREWRPISLETPRKDDLEGVDAALAREPLDIALNLARASRIICPPNAFVWVPTSHANLETVPVRNCVAGIVLRYNETTQRYSLSLIGLVTAKGKVATLTLHRPETGDVMYVGEIASGGGWTLRSTSWPGLTPIQIKGQLNEGVISFDEARSATTVQRALAPPGFEPRMPRDVSARSRRAQGKTTEQ